MSLSRSPSPRRGGGWSSPGLTDSAAEQSSPRKAYDVQMNGSAKGGSHGVTWESASARSQEINGYPSFSTRNQGFFSRHARKLSSSLPTFNVGARRDYADKEKLGRGRWPPLNYSNAGRVLAHLGHMVWRFRLRVGIILGIVLAFVLFYSTRMCSPTAALILTIADSNHSFASSLPTDVLAGRRQQIRNHTGSKSRRGRHGVEGAAGVGH